MLSIGINGFGRIGKCVFLQLIYNPHMDVKVINAPDFDIQNMEYYLKRDSVHQYNKHFHVSIVDENTQSRCKSIGMEKIWCESYY